MLPKRKRGANRSGMTETGGLYVRVSFDKRAHGKAEEIISPETQEDRARQYASSQGWVVEIMEQDLDESAYRQSYTRREGLMRLLQAVKEGRITKIIVFKFNRLARRLRDFLEICDIVESNGGGVVSVSEQIDTSTPAGRLIRNILASFAEFQSEELSEQIFESWITRAKQGLRPPGIAPFGALNEKGVLKPKPGTYEHLVRMYEVFKETRSKRAVWDYLVDNQVAPPRKGKEWSLNTIHKILTNRAYVGELHWVGEVHEAKWQPLMSVELWESVQLIIQGHKTGSTGRKDSRTLSGVVVCGACGRPMWVQYVSHSRSGTRDGFRTYACRNPYSKRTGCDGIPCVNAEEIEASVWQIVTEIAAMGDAFSPRSSSGETSASLNARRRRQLLSESEGTRRAINDLFDLLRTGGITPDQLKEQNLRYLAELQEAQAALDTLPLEGPGAVMSADAVEALGRVQRAESATDRRQILLAIGARVEVDASRAVLHLIGFRINLRARRMGQLFFFGPEYQRLDYQGAMMTDKQVRFLRLSYRWAPKKEVARRLGRSYKAIVHAATRMGLTQSPSSASIAT